MELRFKRLIPARWRAILFGEESGQAMVEYAVITAVFLMGGTALTFFLPAMINAYKEYLWGFYWVLSLPFP